MAKKKTHDPLENLATFDPDAVEAAEPDETMHATRPVSPLGAVPIMPGGEALSGSVSLNNLLDEANRQIAELKERLAAEEERRRSLVQKNYELEAAVKQKGNLDSTLEEERNARLALERKLAAMEVEVREVASLQARLEEERSARMNAQSRAASAEAKLSRLEGELAREGADSASILKRLRGR